jgi:hypothetical protein
LESGATGRNSLYLIGEPQHSTSLVQHDLGLAWGGQAFYVLTEFLTLGQGSEDGPVKAYKINIVDMNLTKALQVFSDPSIKCDPSCPPSIGSMPPIRP